MLPSQETIPIEFKDTRTDELYKGMLTIHRKSQMDDINIRALKSKMNNGLQFASDSDERESNMLATVLLVFGDPQNGAEQWFKEDSIFGNGLVYHLYKKHIEFESKFFRPSSRRELLNAIRSIETASEKQSTDKPKDKATDMVREDVPPAEGERNFSEVTVGGVARKVSGT